MNQPGGFIDPHGGFRNLKSYQMSEIVYDATVVFCDRWIGRRSRTHDQMVQAARSGKQNIAEGSMASGTSKKFELKLVGVARASLEELLLDYHDFLRQRKLPLWGKNHPQAQRIRKLAYVSNRSYTTYTLSDLSSAIPTAPTKKDRVTQTVTQSFSKYSVKSSAVRLVSVVTRTRSPFSTPARISASRKPASATR